MNAIVTFWKKRSRGLRIFIYLLSIACCMLALYTYLGAPTFSVEKDFRRMEKAHMVGPSEILATVPLESGFASYQKMIIAENETGVTFYCYNHVELDPPALVYREKTGDLTVLGSPYPIEARTRMIKSHYPVYLFDNYPEAVRAEMDITLSAEYFGESFEKTYSLQANRVHEGFFQFILGVTNRQGLGIEGYAIQLLALRSGYEGKYYRDFSVPVTVRLYSESDKLLCEQSMEITSVMTQAHRNRGE